MDIYQELQILAEHYRQVAKYYYEQADKRRANGDKQNALYFSDIANRYDVVYSQILAVLAKEGK